LQLWLNVRSSLPLNGGAVRAISEYRKAKIARPDVEAPRPRDVAQQWRHTVELLAVLAELWSEQRGKRSSQAK
jgi:hypothetical protein